MSPAGDSRPTSESLDFSERWLRDGLRVLQPALMVYQSTVEMSPALGRLDGLRAQGVRASTTHLLIQATARALAANPDLHQIVAGFRRLRPAEVDIGLSTSGESFVDPVIVIRAANGLTIPEIADAVTRGAPQARAEDRRLRQLLRRVGWLLPFAFLRRALLRLLFSSPAFRRAGAGTFQVSTVPVEWAAGASFSAAGLLIGGAVLSRVVVVAGQPIVRPTMTLTLCADHGVWDGRAAARLLAAIRTELESEAIDEKV